MDFRILLVCFVIGSIIGLVCVLIPDVVYADEFEYDNTFVRISDDTVYNISVTSGAEPYYFKAWDGQGAYFFIVASPSINLDTVIVPSKSFFNKSYYYLVDGNFSAASGELSSKYQFLYRADFIFRSQSANEYEIFHYIEIPYDANLSYERRIWKFFSEGDSTGFDFTHALENPTHTRDLGALANLKIYNLHVPIENTNPIGDIREFDTAYRFTFDSRTTTGFNLRSVNDPRKLGVRVWTKVCYYRYSDGSLYLESPDIGIGTFDPYDLSIQFSLDEYKTILSTELPDAYNLGEMDLLINRVYRCDSIYFQVVDQTLGQGYILRVKKWLSFSLGKTESDGQVVDWSGNDVSESDGGYSKSLDRNDGFTDSSGNFDSAFDNAINNGGWSPGTSADSIESAIQISKDMLGMVGNIPTAIGKLLSFLPPWCLKYLSLCFVALGLLIIYKLIRG